MKNNEQFRIDTIEELEQAYEMFKDEWQKNCPLEREKRYFNLDTGARWVVKTSEGNVYLYSEAGFCKTIPSPLKQPQYPCEMLVSSDNCNWHKRTVIAKHEGNYYAVNNHITGAASWSHVKPIPKTIKLTKAQVKAIIRNAQNLDPNTKIIITD